MRLFVLLTLTVAFLSSGCDAVVECGDGTIERNGFCEFDDTSREPASCGVGTFFDPDTQECRSDFEPVMCDPETTVEIRDPVTGVVTCVGDGSSTCAAPLVCGEPSAGKVSICGRIIDVGSGEPLQIDGTSTAICQDPATGGPCALGMAFFDAQAFVTNPAAPPQAFGSLTVDECGRFRAVDVDPPVGAIPALGIGLNDHPGSGADDFVQTGAAFPAAGGAVINGLRVYIVSNSTDETWTSDAGNPPALEGMTFGEKGVYLALFHNDNVPVAGVQIALGEPPTIADKGNMFYFSDTDSRILSVDPNQEATGANGAGLLVNSPLGLHTGIGGLEPECSWPSSQAAAIAGTVFVQERPMQCP